MAQVVPAAGLVIKRTDMALDNARQRERRSRSTRRALELYRLQLEIRYCEKRAYDLFLQNLVKGTSHLSLGQEAIAAGFGVAMHPDDWTFCTYRGHAPHARARRVDDRRCWAS